MQLKSLLTMTALATTLAPLVVTEAEANTKVIRTSYNRISPSCVKETKIIKTTRLISQAKRAKHVIHHVAYAVPNKRTFTTTTRTTSMFIPASQLSTAMVVPSKTIVRTTAIAPRTTIVKTTTVTPTMLTPIVGSRVITAPYETVVYKEKHGKLNEVGTLRQAAYY